MRRIIAVLAAICAFTTPAVAAAQAAFRGNVTDSLGTPVPQVSVVLSPGGLSAMTNNRGDFAIARVPDGTYTVTARRIGFAAESFTITVAGADVERNIVLRQLATMLMTARVIGSRARHTAAEELAVPVDVFTGEQIRAQGTNETSQILAQLSPSVNFPRQSVSDATEIVRPFTMRGLSPDHTLVLINGKRRHHTALIHYYGAGQGAGSSGVDMNAIPSGAIDRLEVLRDGAAAQYGSDAIAGVVNVVLKEGAFDPFVTANYGQYMTGEENPAALPEGGKRPSFESDGETLDLNGGFGLALGRASFGLFAEYRDRQPTNRAGPDASDMFGSDADEVVDGFLVTKNNSIPQPNHHWGDGASKDLMTFASARFPFDSAGALGAYAFGGYSFRQGTGFGYFRAPSSERNFTEIYPNGFLPRFAPDVTDISGAAGVRGALNEWGYDVGTTVGYNAFEYTLENTLNTSLGPCLVTPCAPGRDGILGNADDPGIPNKTRFFAGELRLLEAILSLDASREMQTRMFASPVNVAFGTAFRRERYRILPGEPASYINGFHKASDSSIAPTGSQVFPGFRDLDHTEAYRSNIGAYVDVEGDVMPNLLANIAARYEHYSDFGSKVTGKLAGRLQPSPMVTFRAAVQTGFRAPSLNQSWYSSVVTNFKPDETTGEPVPFEIGIFPVSSPEAKALGAKTLKAESSNNVSAGFAVTPVENFTVTADAYFIAVNDRIVLTGFLDTPEVATILRNIGSRAEAAQYFTNAIDTRTTGFDLIADWRGLVGAGTAGLNLAFNYTKTTIPNEDDIPLPPELEGTGEELIGKYDEGGLFAMTNERPKWRGTLTGQYAFSGLSGLLRYSYYGTYESSLYSYSGDDVQKYGAKGLVDVEVGYSPMPAFKVSIGARNLFDTYPDKMSYNNGFDIFPFPPASPFGYNGRFIYTQLEWTGTRRPTR